MLKIQKKLDSEVKDIYSVNQEKSKVDNRLAQNELLTTQLKENIKNLEDKVSSAESHSKELEKGFTKKMTQSQEDKSNLEKKIKKMEKEETQKELETNALITQTLADLKKYQNMDQMKEEEDKEIRNQTTVLQKKLDTANKTITSLDKQLSESMKKSMVVIGAQSQQLMHEKEKEIKDLSQLVETKSKIVNEKGELSKLH